jgi:hypothetical protein
MDDTFWENAIMAFFHPSPSLKPLADLLRSGEPIPQNIRNVLAQMMDPGPDGRGYMDRVLEMKDTGTQRNSFEIDVQRMLVTAQFDALYQAGGISIEEAAEEIGRQQKPKIDAKTVKRHKKRTKEFLKTLPRKHAGHSS